MTDKTENLKPLVRTEQAWRDQLTPEQYRITRQGGTERAFTGEFWDQKTPGLYSCVCCELPLFRSQEKYASGCGWPSYTAPFTGGNVRELRDTSLGMVRTEVRCQRCDAHLGHVFPDGPPPLGIRYCINSGSLKFAPDEG